MDTSVICMEDVTGERALYEAIIRIRKICKKRPHEENIIKEASKTSGLTTERLRKTLSSLVNNGMICVSKTPKGNESYYISNIEDPEALVELDDQSDVSVNLNDPNNFEFPTPRAELQFNGQNSPIEKKDFMVFLNIVGKLTDDIRGLQLKIDELGSKNERLLKENCDLRLKLNTQLELINTTSNKQTYIQYEQIPSTKIHPIDPIVHSNSKKDKIQHDLATQLKEVQARKHQQYLRHKSELNTKINPNSAKKEREQTSYNKKTTNIKNKNHNYNVNNNRNIDVNANNQICHGEWNNSGKNKRNSRSKKSNSHSSKGSQVASKSSNICSVTRKINPKQDDESCDNNSKSNASKKVLLLGDSHVRRVGESNFLANCFIAKGIGGLLSGQLISKHRGSVNSILPNVDEVVIHVGSNDISKGISQEKVVENITLACKRLKEVNPNVRIIVSSILLQKYDTPKNLYIVESNAALERNCFSNGWDFLNNSNIAFKHIDKWGMHLTPEGYHLFASNLHAHSFSG